MAIIPMRNTCTVYQSGVLDDWGKPTTSAGTVYKCRIVRGRQGRDRDADDREQRSGGG